MLYNGVCVLQDPREQFSQRILALLAAPNTMFAEEMDESRLNEPWGNARSDLDSSFPLKTYGLVLA